jgi:hypothetical protein
MGSDVRYWRRPKFTILDMMICVAMISLAFKFNRLFFPVCMLIFISISSRIGIRFVDLMFLVTFLSIVIGFLIVLIRTFR